MDSIKEIKIDGIYNGEITIASPKSGIGVEYLTVNGKGTGYNHVPIEVLDYCVSNSWNIIIMDACSKGYIVQASRNVGL